jgi:hypothetical protein
MQSVNERPKRVTMEGRVFFTKIDDSLLPHSNPLYHLIPNLSKRNGSVKSHDDIPNCTSPEA